MNRTIITGNLTRNVDLLQTSNGVTYSHFTVAVNGESTDTDGNKQTFFFPCTAWKNKAESLAAHCKKGSRVLVEGEMQSRKYTDNEGKEQVAWNLSVKRIEFIDGAKRSDEEFVSPARSERPQMTQIEDDRLPF